MNATSRPSTRTKIAKTKIETKSQLSRIPSAFGDSGATGANWARREETATDCHSMNVPESPPQGTRVRLPADVVRPFEVFVNGVEQREGADYRIDGRTLVFERALKTEGQARLLALALAVDRNRRHVSPERLGRRRVQAWRASRSSPRASRSSRWPEVRLDTPLSS